MTMIKVTLTETLINSLNNLLAQDVNYCNDKDRETITKYLTEHEINGKISMRKCQILAKKVQRYKTRRHLEYVTSPESETYWCS